jgi:Ni/Co efflux regulator RcnB
MRIGKQATLAAASAVAMMISAAPLAARAEIAGGVVDCDAPGHAQVGGALLGAVLGGVAGSNLAKNDRGTGTVIGATAGAAAGSYVGCRMQKSNAAKAEAAPPPPRPRAAAYRDDYEARARPVNYGEDDRYDDRGGPPGLAKKPHHMPPGLAKKYYGVGERLPVTYVRERDHYVIDPPRYGLRYAPAGYRWVAVGDDAYLVRTRTGVITDVVRAILG